MIERESGVEQRVHRLQGGVLFDAHDLFDEAFYEQIDDTSTVMSPSARQLGKRLVISQTVSRAPLTGENGSPAVPLLVG